MKPSELYARQPEKVERELDVLFKSGGEMCFIPELDDIQTWTHAYDLEKQTSIEVKTLKYFQCDHRRIWWLSTIWFEGQPVMIIQRAGREGDDHLSRFVTDAELYTKMVDYLSKLFYPVFKHTTVADLVEPDSEVKDLGNFYGRSIDGPFYRD